MWPSAPEADQLLAELGTSSRAGEDTPLASGPPSGDAERDDAVAGRELDATPATAYLTGSLLTATTHSDIHEPVFDSVHAAELYPELEALDGWSWWWVGCGTTTLLVGYHQRDASAVDMLYIDSDEDTTVTRTDITRTDITRTDITRTDPPRGLRVHETGRLLDVLALL